MPSFRSLFIIIEKDLVYIGMRQLYIDRNKYISIGLDKCLVFCKICQHFRLSKFYLTCFVKIAMHLDVPCRYWSLKSNVYMMTKVCLICFVVKMSFFIFKFIILSMYKDTSCWFKLHSIPSIFMEYGTSIN